MEFPPAAGSHANRYVSARGCERAALAMWEAWFVHPRVRRQSMIAAVASAILGVALAARTVRKTWSKARPLTPEESRACQASSRSSSVDFSSSATSASSSSVSSASRRGSFTCTPRQCRFLILLYEVMVGVFRVCQRAEVERVDGRQKEQFEVRRMPGEKLEIVLNDVVPDQIRSSRGEFVQS